MTIKTNDLQNLEKFGVYKILNSKNKKYYIGSTIDSFTKRLNHHYHALKREIIKIYIYNEHEINMVKKILNLLF